jgi:STE24 endopeptidase
VSSRSLAALALAALVIALAVVVLLRVPWSVAPAPRSDQLTALRDLPPDAVARGRTFHAALRPGTYGTLVISQLMALLLGLTPIGARIIDVVSRPLGGHWLVQAVVGGLAVVLVTELVTLPFAVWRQRVLREYGLSIQDWGSWSVDALKIFGVGAVIGVVALAGFFTVTRLFTQSWWAVGAVGAAALVILLTFVFPVLVDPLFNRLTPMKDSPLRTDLIQMAARDGVPVRDVLVADASRRTTALNAYVSGLAATRRIVVYDTMLRESPEDEVRSVVAHELSHAKSNDVLTGTLIGALEAAAAVCALYLLGSWTPLLRRAGVESIAEPRAVALLIAVVAVAGLLAGPPQAFLSRRIEARADAHALALTDDPVTFEAMMSRMAVVNLADVDPNPVEKWLFASHPSTVERLAMARAWVRS